jgi:hypothetical protein
MGDRLAFESDRLKCFHPLEDLVVYCRATKNQCETKLLYFYSKVPSNSPKRFKNVDEQ